MVVTCAQHQRTLGSGLYSGAAAPPPKPCTPATPLGGYTEDALSPLCRQLLLLRGDGVSPVPDDTVGFVTRHIGSEELGQRLSSEARLTRAGRAISEEGYRDACERGDTGLCKLYLEAGYSAAAFVKGAPRLSSDATPLRTAIESGALDLAALLLERGAPTDERDCSGQTPLIGAGCDAASLLLRHGAVIDAKDGDGQTALMLACQACDIRLVNLLLRHGADPMVADACGMTALSDACRYGFVAGVDALLQAGASPATRDSSGLSPADHAEENLHGAAAARVAVRQ